LFVVFVSLSTMHLDFFQFPVTRSLILRILGGFDTSFFFVLSLFRVFVIAVLFSSFASQSFYFTFLRED
jgi:hypothetical protein